jgi:hypothetical protein
MIFRFTLLLGLSLSMANTFGQNPDFKVMINKERLQPGDTLDLVADYAIGGRQLPPATFVLTILGPNEKIWQLRWPMIEGHSEASIIFPDSAVAGAYNLLFAVQPRFLKLFGEVIHPEPPAEIGALLVAGANMTHLPIKTSPNGKFVIENLLLEGNAAVSFSHKYNVPGPPMVKLDAWLDSSFQPAATGVKQIVVNHAGQNTYTPNRLRKDSVFANGYDLLSQQYLIRKKMDRYGHLQGLTLYDSMYLQPPFDTSAGKVIDCLSDTSALNKPSVYELLNATLPKMELLVWGDYNVVPRNASPYMEKLETETMVKWNEKWYRLYFNGVYGDASALVFPVNALAEIRVYDPPFFKVPQSNKTFGVIAFFERKFPFQNPFPYNNRYLIQGYSPDLVKLPF